MTESGKQRRAELAALIDRKFFGRELMGLKPEEMVLENFDPMMAWDCGLADVVFSLAADLLDHESLMDHGWKLRSTLPPWRESIGIVSESYVSEERARRALGMFPAETGLMAHILPKDNSAWAPGACVVIVVLVVDFRVAERWAAKRMIGWREEDWA